MIFYAANWTQQKNISPDAISIAEEDIQGFIESLSGLSGKNLDLVIHSPGGSAEVTEQIIKILRERFEHIRAIVPFGAMSAATMLACGADEILMPQHSFLGPIDPQFLLQTPTGIQSIPAQAILEQFERAKKEYKENKDNIVVWLPIVQHYGPALLTQCENAIQLSKSLVGEWLENYMFKSDSSKKAKAEKTAEELSYHNNFRSHARHINREQARKLGLKIVNLESDAVLNDNISSLFNATTIMFDTSQIVKLIENHNSKGFYKSVPLK